MHLTIPIYGYNAAFANKFDISTLDWDAIYNVVSTYLDADYFDYVNDAEADLENNNSGYVIVMRNAKEAVYCGEDRWFDKWPEVKYIGSIDVHC